MPRRHRDQSFRKADVVRAYKAAQDAGMPHPRIVIDTAAKRITIVPGAAPTDGDQTNEWDQVCEAPNK